MTYLNLIKYPLLPVLIPQGIWTKWHTPRLPEAMGERQGISGKGKIIRLLILGDSAAAGVGVNQQKDALLGQLLKQFDLEHYQVHWQLHAKSGNTLLNLQQILQEVPAQSFDIVIISSGVNDILQQHSALKWQQNFLHLYRSLQAYFGQPQILFTQVPPLQYFTALPKQLAWYLGKWSNYYNQQLHSHSKHLVNFHYVAIDLPTSREYLATDGFHPSHLSYTIWAQDIFKYLSKEKLL